MNPRRNDPAHQAAFFHLNEVRAQALHHTRIAQEMSAESRTIIHDLIDAGFSQAAISREMGVSRQAVQKMCTHLDG